MARTRKQEEERFGWSAFSTKLKLLTFTVLALTILMSTAHSLGIDTGDAQRGDDLVSGLLGKGEVRSLFWLWVARISIVGIVVTVIMMRREERRISRERREQSVHSPDAISDTSTKSEPGQW